MSFAVLDRDEIKEELVVFLRNSDIFTVAQRGVTTTSDTGSWSATKTHLINRSNVRNIRSITVDGSSLSFGTDYFVDYYFNDSGTRKCKISLVGAQTGEYEISYDYGSSDKIFPDFPRPELSISSFPRIGCDIISVVSSPGGFQNVMRSDIEFTVVAYDKKVEDLADYIKAIRQAFLSSYNSFYYLKVIRPVREGPVLKSPREKGKDKILQQNVDFVSYYNYEVN